VTLAIGRRTWRGTQGRPHTLGRRTRKISILIVKVALKINVVCPLFFHAFEDLWGKEGISFDEKTLNVFVPPNSEYFVAIGAALYHQYEQQITDDKWLENFSQLEAYLEHGRGIERENGIPGLLEPNFSLEAFKNKYFNFTTVAKQTVGIHNQQTNIFIGLDAGSTSTKAVALDEEANILASSYRLSDKNPIEEAKIVLQDIYEQLQLICTHFTVKSVSVTGYAKDILKLVLNTDVAVVETVAHLKAATFFYDDVDVIVDVGGQDIKVLFIKNQQVFDFRLNTQCSAGNGYYMQNTAEKFGIKLENYAETAFRAEWMPNFNFGCAVFLESDIVSFQQQGWEVHEILAGLAHVLPKTIWEYMVQEYNLAKFGHRFVLQGGVHKNLAAVKAHLDYITQKVPQAEVIVHKHCAETGAIGSALIGFKEYKSHPQASSKFIGFHSLRTLKYLMTRDESTLCAFCTSACLRTFIDIKSGNKKARSILANCEKGTADSMQHVKIISKTIKQKARLNPNFVSFLNERLFKPIPRLESVDVSQRNFSQKVLQTFSKAFSRNNGKKVPSKVRVGIHRILNMWRYAPFFMPIYKVLVFNPTILFGPI